MPRVRHAFATLLLMAVWGCSEYSNSTKMGRTRADDQTIQDVRTAIALLDRTPTEALTRMAEESSRRDTSYTGAKLKLRRGNTFEFFCRLPCKRHELMDGLTSDLLPEVEKITPGPHDGGALSELWHVRIGVERKIFQVSYFDVPGGRARKPDNLYVKRF